MKDRKLESLSKFLSLLLRHKPDILNLKMSKEGFVDLDELVQKIRSRKNFAWVTREDIESLVKGDEKGRFEIKVIDRREFIRVRYGHSLNLPVEVDYQKVSLGEVKVLYHGTRKDVLPYILKEGLKPMARKFVHLTKTPEDALIVARRRRGSAVILKIDVESFLKDGGVIYKATDRIYLAKEIPPKYIKIHKYGV